MICPRCNKEIDYESSVCPYCGNNLSFTTKARNEENIQLIEKLGEKGISLRNTLQKTVTIGVILTLILLLVLIIIFEILGLFYINNLFRIIDIGLKVTLTLGIISFVICLLLFIFKKRFRLLKFIWIISIGLILVPIIARSIVQIKVNISLKDYSTIKYIELGSEKIPSLYSVVGKREIIFSHNENNTIDEDLSINVDMVAIGYTELSTEDKLKYKEALLEYGFVTQNIYNSDEQIYQELYVKNNINDNTFYVVSIDGLSILYYKSSGKYQDVLPLEY